jgi:hypothetical protein
MYRYLNKNICLVEKCRHGIHLNIIIMNDRFCGLVVKVSDYRSRGPGSIYGTTSFSERGPLSLVSTKEELLEGKISGFGLENRYYSHRESVALTT